MRGKELYEYQVGRKNIMDFEQESIEFEESIKVTNLRFYVTYTYAGNFKLHAFGILEQQMRAKVAQEFAHGQ